MAGLHVPVKPLVEVVGKSEMAVPAQNGPKGSKDGVIGSEMTMVRVVATPHWPALGVKVYSVVCVLSMAGLQEPVIPSLDVVGKPEMAAPTQNEPTAVKVGVISVPIVMVNVAGNAHWFTSGVKV